MTIMSIGLLVLLCLGIVSAALAIIVAAVLVSKKRAHNSAQSDPRETSEH